MWLNMSEQTTKKLPKPNMDIIVSGDGDYKIAVYKAGAQALFEAVKQNYGIEAGLGEVNIIGNNIYWTDKGKARISERKGTKDIKFQLIDPETYPHPIIRKNAENYIIAKCFLQKENGGIVEGEGIVDIAIETEAHKAKKGKNIGICKWSFKDFVSFAYTRAFGRAVGKAYAIQSYEDLPEEDKEGAKDLCRIIEVEAFDAPKKTVTVDDNIDIDITPKDPKDDPSKESPKKEEPKPQVPLADDIDISLDESPKIVPPEPPKPIESPKKEPEPTKKPVESPKNFFADDIDIGISEPQPKSEPITEEKPKKESKRKKETTRAKKDESSDVNLDNFSLGIYLDDTQQNRNNDVMFQLLSSELLGLDGVNLEAFWKYVNDKLTSPRGHNNIPLANRFMITITNYFAELHQAEMGDSIIDKAKQKMQYFINHCKKTMQELDPTDEEFIIKTIADDMKYSEGQREWVKLFLTKNKIV